MTPRDGMENKEGPHRLHVNIRFQENIKLTKLKRNERRRRNRRGFHFRNKQKRDHPTVKSSNTGSFFTARTLSYQYRELKSWQLVTQCIDWLETLVSLNLYLNLKYRMKLQRQKVLVYCSLNGTNTPKPLLFSRTVLYKELILVIQRSLCPLENQNYCFYYKNKTLS